MTVDPPVNLPPLWTSLVRYYRSCLAREQELSVRVPADAVILPEIDEHLISRRATTTILADPRQTRPILAYLNRRGRGISGTFIYGYPLVRHGDSLTPLFYTEVRLEPGSAPQTILVTRGNAELLANRQFLVEAAGLTDEEASGLLRDLRSPRSGQVAELLESYLLEVEVRYDAVLFAAESAVPIRGSGRELQLMEQLRKERLPDTIRTFIGEQGISSAKPTPDRLTILPADPTQAAALARLQASFLVVTGPAGSGKTQTAINLIAGAAALGQRVLYISPDQEAVERAFRELSPCFPGVLKIGSREARAAAMTYARHVLRSIREQVGAAAVALDQAERPADPPEAAGALAGESRRLGEELARLDAEVQERLYLERLLAELALREQQVAAALAGHPVRSYAERLASQLTPATAALFRPEQLVALRRLIVRTAGWGSEEGSLGGRLRERVRINQIKAGLKEAGLPEFCHPDGDVPSLVAGLKRLEQAFPLLLVRARRLHAEAKLAALRPLAESQAALDEAARAKAEVDRRRLRAAWLAVAERVRPRCDELEAIIAQEEAALAGDGKQVRRRGRLGELLAAFPVVLSPTLAVAGAIPNEPELFDLLILDDGSRVDIPSFLPVLYRAKRLCVLGDEEGPRHRTWLGQEEDSRLLDRVQGWNLAPFAYVETSVLDRAIQVVGRDHVVRLSRQYRASEGDPSALLLEDVADGETIYPAEAAVSQAQNPLEARRTVQLATQQIERGETDLAILTPFRGQALLIRTLLARLAEIEPNPERAAALRRVTVAYGDPVDLRPHGTVLISLVAARGATAETLRWLEQRRTALHRMIAAGRTAVLVCHRATLASAGGALADLVSRAGGAGESAPAPLPPGLQPERLGLLEDERPLVRDWLVPPSLPADGFSEAERQLYGRLAELLRGRPVLIATRLSLASVLDPAVLAGLAPAEQEAAVESLLLFTLVDSRTLQPLAAVELEDGTDTVPGRVKEPACRLAGLPLVRLRPGEWEPLDALLPLFGAT